MIIIFLLLLLLLPLLPLLLHTVPDGRMLMCLEGGYEPDGVSVCISAVLTAMVQFDNPHARARYSDKNKSSSTGDSSDGSSRSDRSSSSDSSSSSTMHSSEKVHSSTGAVILSLRELLKPHWNCFK